MSFAAPPENDARVTPVVKAVAKVLPSVVNIGTERIIAHAYSPWGASDPFEGLFRDFYAEQGEEMKTVSLGSGSIIDTGLVLTNFHVVSRASKINILSSGGRNYTAKIVASDEVNDVALLQILENLMVNVMTPIKFAKPGELFLGEPVIAVGNPYGLGNSISSGVLSAIGRKAMYGGKIIFNDILQTDAAINPGNSGGPLININAEMIGMNTAMHRQAQGIGFAVPLKRIEDILAKWLVPERFADVSLGIIPGAKMLAPGKEEIFVDEVIEASPAWKAGIRKNDRIIQVNGKDLESLIELSRTLWKLKRGDSVELKTGRGVYTLVVGGLAMFDGEELARVRLGLTLQKLTKRLAEALDYPVEGGLVVSDAKGIPKISRGDILIRLADIPVNDFQDIQKALGNKYYGETIEAIFGTIVKRGGEYVLVRKVVPLAVK